MGAHPLPCFEQFHYGTKFYVCQDNGIPKWNFDAIMPKKQRKQVEPEIMSEVELLRLERTEYSRDEFVVHCGFGRGSYYRWIKGETEGKVTLKQLKQMAKILKIEAISELPDDFCSLPSPQTTPNSETSRPIG